MKRIAILALACAYSIASSALAASPSTRSPFRLMSAEKEIGLRKLLPKLDDENTQALLDDKRLMLYTEQEMPRCHQDWDSGLPGVHSPYYNISANNSERFGNGNREFPWGTPAGTHRAANLFTFRFLSLPHDANGRPLPVVYYRKHLRGDASTGYAWMFPVGTVFGEVLCIKTPGGQAVPFELRIRKREQVAWDVDVFRPFPTAEALAERIKKLRCDWQAQPAVAKLVAHLEADQKLPVRRLVDNTHPNRRVIDQTMGVDNLPAISDDKLVVELLTTTTFTSAQGEIWRKGTNATHTNAPTTTARFHVVPANYDAGFIEVDQHSCMRCHQTANQHVRNFDAGRDWYGRVRGSDGIFSWHPFDPAAISGNGYGSAPRIRASLVNAGIVAPYNAKVHRAATYRRVRGLDE
jgi:hypothetical protein